MSKCEQSKSDQLTSEQLTSEPSTSEPSTSEQYRRFARECLEMAEDAADPRVQALMVHMAQVWLRLAQKHEAPAEQQHIV